MATGYGYLFYEYVETHKVPNRSHRVLKDVARQSFWPERDGYRDQDVMTDITYRG
jgi:hypothetical protein